MDSTPRALLVREVKHLLAPNSLGDAAACCIERDVSPHVAGELLYLSGQAERAVQLVDASIAEAERRNLSGKLVALQQLHVLRNRLLRLRET
ncbi:MAG TPA: hypothetical protein VNB23_10515 [Ramlibacter sp.]|nr:hypothetical protein [Ramlibacter sp.]